jgi:hypothetical protein
MTSPRLYLEAKLFQTNVARTLYDEVLCLSNGTQP